MKKSSKSPTNRLKKIGTRFLENIVGGKGGNPRALKFDEEQAMADVHADEVLQFEEGDARLIAHEKSQAAEEAAEKKAGSSDEDNDEPDILGYDEENDTDEDMREKVKNKLLLGPKKNNES